MLLASYDALRTQRFDRANGLLGPLLQGDRTGQTFVARYSNLSGIDLLIGTGRQTPGPAQASLVLHLRVAPTSGLDVATAYFPAGELVDVNPWYHFSFPPIANSQGRQFYLEVESPDGAPGHALTLLWWQSTSDSQLYPDGTAYRNGEPQAGDLAFGLRYAPSPLDVWAYTVHAAGIDSYWAAPALLLVIFVIAGPALFAKLPALWSDPPRRRTWLLRWSLPLVLVIALLNGLIYLLLVPPWQGPDEPAHFAYVALLDHYNLDIDAVQRLQSTGTGSEAALVSAMSTSMRRSNFTRLVTSYPYPDTPLQTDEGILGALQEPPAYHWLCAAGLRLAQAAGLPVDPYDNVNNALWLLRSFSLVLSLCTVGLAWLAGVLLAHGRFPWLRILLPLTVALLPMHAFISVTATNNGLAELLISALFIILVALLRQPWGRRALGLAALALLLMLVSIPTKSTALFGGIPLLVGGIVLWAGLTFRQWLSRRRESQLLARAPVKYAAVAVVALLLVGTGVLLAYEPQSRADSWRLNRWVVDPIPQVYTPLAHQGKYVIELGPNRPQGIAVEQVLLAPFYHPAFTMTISGWVRRAPVGPASAAQGATARLVLQESTVRIGRTVLPVAASGDWTAITVTAHVSASSYQVVLQLKAPEDVVQFDDLSMQVIEVQGLWDNPIARPRLLNPSFEDGTLGLNSVLARILPLPVQMIASVAVNSQPFDKLALWQYYADGQNRSFWGSFGWLAVPLPEYLYQLIDMLMVVAAVGLIWGAIRRRPRWALPELVGALALPALVVAILIEFGAEMSLLAYRENASFPQGRYIFVLIIPIVWLLLEGLREAWSLLTAGVSRKDEGRKTKDEGVQSDAEQYPVGALSWGGWLWLNAVLTFGGYCLLVLIVPYFWG